MTIPDAAERAQALDPTCSFIVQAPAGAGKTELLIQRYLTLLARVDAPEAVLAITFTKKATGEMRQRVIAALRKSAGPRPEADHEGLTWDLARAVRNRSIELGWDLFRNPGRFQIRTIDSLCASLVRRMPWLSRMGATPAVVENASELYTEAARRTIESLETETWSDSIEALLGHLDNDFLRVQELLAALLARRDHWLRHVAGAADPAAARDTLESALRNAITDGIENARRLVPAELEGEIVEVVAAAGRNLVAAGRDGAATACTGMTRLPVDAEVDAWLGIVETLLKKDDAWRGSLSIANGFPPKSPDKPRAQALLAAVEPHESLRSGLAELRHLPEAHFSDQQWIAMRALLTLLPLAAAQLQVCFRESGQSDYSEIALAAQRALGDPDAPTDLALTLDEHIEHILVDEFQDTSVSQYALLEKLTGGWQPADGRTIFLVGDPMQSIYRFREAEVGLFLKAAREGIGSVPLQPLRLTANFRSSSQVIDWVNATFPSVLPAEEDISTGAITFASSVSTKGSQSGAVVRLHPFIGRDDNAEALRVATLAGEARDRGLKVAILVRARNHLAGIIPALQTTGLRFRAVEIATLATQSLIRDLTSLTCALLHPADRVAWLALLRAPWCGLTLGDLYTLTNDAPSLPIWIAISDQTRVARLDVASRTRVDRLRTALGGAVADRASTLRARVEGAWLAIGGPACSAGPADRENASAFFDLLEDLDTDAPLDPTALAESVEKLYASPDPQADDSIQVMSVHKAKGLEFDVVIVPGLGRKAGTDSARLLRWLERPRLGGATDLLMAPINATGDEADRTYDYLKHIDAQRSEHEDGRVLYVAATRAKAELHLLGHAKVDAKGVVKPAAGSLLERMWTAVHADFEAAAATAPPAPESEAEVERVPRAIERLTVAWKRPAPTATAPLPSDRGVTEREAERVSFRWVGDTLRHIGTVTHDMLRRVAEDGAAGWDAARIAGSRVSVRSALLELGVPSRDLPAAVDTVAQAVERTLSDDRGKWLLAGGADSACEVPITGLDAGDVIHARVDRTFVDADGVRWVIDYKTSNHQGAGLSAFLDRECDRYAPQLTRYRRLFAALDHRPVRTALYFPLLGGWREIAAAAAQPGQED
jgi:ATP-dependent helicase/nuclease subunit A